MSTVTIKAADIKALQQPDPWEVMTLEDAQRLLGATDPGMCRDGGSWTATCRLPVEGAPLVRLSSTIRYAFTAHERFDHVVASGVDRRQWRIKVSRDRSEIQIEPL